MKQRNEWVKTVRGVYGKKVKRNRAISEVILSQARDLSTLYC